MAPLAATAALALAACGSGTGTSAPAQTGSGPSPEAMAFATCMRGHGVPQFPDPGGRPRTGSSISILGSRLPPNTNIKAPAFQSALKVCMRRLLAGHPRPPVSAARKASILKAAGCMRTHGVPNFPDPKFPPGGGIGIATPPGVGPSSPAFQHAVQVCGGL
jgi:hypothetical protein